MFLRLMDLLRFLHHQRDGFHISKVRFVSWGLDCLGLHPIHSAPNNYSPKQLCEWWAYRRKDPCGAVDLCLARPSELRLSRLLLSLVFRVTLSLAPAEDQFALRGKVLHHGEVVMLNNFFCIAL